MNFGLHHEGYLFLDGFHRPVHECIFRPYSASGLDGPCNQGNRNTIRIFFRSMRAVELEIENPLAARSVSGVREWMVLESTEDITGSISVKDAEVAKRWTVKVDGGSVTLKYRPVGTIMVVR